MKKLRVQHFGPIVEVELELKKFTVLIGPPASGKSMLAKLLMGLEEMTSAPNLPSNYQLYKWEGDRRTLDGFLFQQNILFGLNDRSVFTFSLQGQTDAKAKSVIVTNENIESTAIFERINPFNELTLVLIKLRDWIEELGYSKSTLEESGTDYSNKDTQSPTQKDQQVLGELMNTLRLNLPFLPEKGFWLHLSKFLDKHQVLPVFRDVESVRSSLFEVSHILESAIRSAQQESLYVPAERIVIPAISNAILSLINTGVALPRSILSFGTLYEKARSWKENVRLPSILFEGVSFEGGAGLMVDQLHLNNTNQTIRLTESASGMQSAVPLLLTCGYFSQAPGNQKLIIVEEPENHLFPLHQKKLLEYLVKIAKAPNIKLILTTHSPYILTAFNNLIQAQNVAKAQPDLKGNVAEEIPENLWVNFQNVAAYYIADGGAKSILNEENKLIGGSELDAVSEQMGNTFDELLDLAFSS